jgi:HPt (histidine-containing phosphotransfer) domain-containing protein
VSDFDERLESLRRRFGRRAAEEREQLAAALEARDREAVRRISHGLAGSGGVFGHPELSAIAQKVEEAIDAGADEAAVATLSTRLIEELDAVAQRA